MSHENTVTKNHFENTKEVLLIILFLVAVLALLYHSKPTFLPFKPFTESDILAIVSALFVVAIFMERSIEAILIPVRKPDRMLIEQKIKILRNEVKTDAGKEIELSEQIYKLENYRMTTAKHALWVSFGFGLLISLVGVRTLAGLIEPQALKQLGEIHSAMFAFVDTVLTGGVIAGGSAAIDKIGRKLSVYLTVPEPASDNAPDK